MSVLFAKQIALAAVTAAITFTGAAAAPQINQPAPDFTGTDSNGDTFTLSEDAAGKRVILEWTNHDCPYVRKHYETENMQTLQQEAAERDTMWVTIISSAEGKQGHVSGQKANELTTSRNASPDLVLLDPGGDIGRLYDAKTTPHMFVIDEEGIVRYMGAIDDNSSSRKSTVENARNYVRAAMVELDAGTDVTDQVTTPYGCSVKYVN